jgi:hypothetical protein
MCVMYINTVYSYILYRQIMNKKPILIYGKVAESDSGPEPATWCSVNGIGNNMNLLMLDL